MKYFRVASSVEYLLMAAVQGVGEASQIGQSCQHGPTLPKIRPNSTNIRRSWPNFWPIVATSAKLGSYLPNLGRRGPATTNLRPNSANVGGHSPHFSRISPHLPRFGSDRPSLADIVTDVCSLSNSSTDRGPPQERERNSAIMVLF